MENYKPVLKLKLATDKNGEITFMPSHTGRYING